MKIFNPEDTRVKEAIVVGTLDEWKIVVEIICAESAKHPKKKNLKRIADDLAMVACY